MENRCATTNCLRVTHGREYCSTCRVRRWRAANTLRSVYSAFKSNAKRRGIVVEITIEDFEIWCGTNGYLELRGVDADSMTIDRIYDFDENGNKAPYRYDNMVMRTKSFNSAKPAQYMSYKKKEIDIF